MIQDLTDLIDRLVALPWETECVDFKESYADPEKEGKDICALANSAALCGERAAYKVWGISDVAHEVTGTKFNPRTKKKGEQPLEIWLRKMLSDNAHFEFMPTTYRGRNVVVLHVWPATNYPVRFEGTAYIRTNSSTQVLAPGSSREIELWRKLGHESFEDLVARGDLTADEVLELLDHMTYFDLLAMPRPSGTEFIMHYLIEDGLVQTQEDGKFAITNLGALLLAKNLSQFPLVRRKTLRIIRYDGKGRASDRREREMVQGYAVSIDAAYDFVDGSLPSMEGLAGARRDTRHAFPQSVIRELIVNALMHQDLTVVGAGPMVEVFDNRVEFTNPGIPLVRIEDSQ